MIRTVDYKDHKIILIDQNRLPHEFVTVELFDYKEAADAIRTMKVRGAPALGVTAALAVAVGALSVNSNSFIDFYTELVKIADTIKATRPTAVNLFWGVDRMLAAARSSRDKPVSEIKNILEQLAVSMIQEDEDTCRRIGRIGAELLSDGSCVLTHCNAGGLACACYGTALGVVRAAVESGKKLRVFADETRPRLQGMKLTAWELAQDGIDVTIIADSMAASLMRRGLINACIVGADRIAADGDVANKIGTYSIAVLAKFHDIPFYVAAPVSTVDPSIARGEDIPIEERSEEEMTHIDGRRIAPEGVKVINPAFDVTPAHLISAIVTERGIARAPYEDSIKSLIADQEGAAR